MKTKNLAIATTAATVAIMALLIAYPAMASSQPLASAQKSVQTAAFDHLKNADRHRINLSVGQTITLTSIAGGYREVGNPSVNGTATGTLTLQVSGSFRGGYALTVTGGSITVNGTTYTVSGGSGELGPYGVHMIGQGQAGDSTQFLFHARSIGKFGSNTFGILGVDLKSGSNEFAVRLLVTISIA